MPKRPATKPRKEPRQARSKATVDAILTAAARILVEAGYERANVNDVARRAGVSVGSLYQYYPTKEALVSAVLQRDAERSTALYEAGLPEVAQGPVRAAVRECVRRALAVYAHEPGLRRVIAEVPSLASAVATPDWDEMIETAFREYMRFHRASFRPRNVDMAAKIVRVAVEAVVVDYTLKAPERLRSDELLNEVVDLVERYLLADRDNS